MANQSIQRISNDFDIDDGLEDALSVISITNLKMDW